MITFHEWEGSGPARRAAASLVRDEIQVWTAGMPLCEPDLSGLARVLSPDELERAARFTAPKPRDLFLFGRIFLRQLLSACLNADPAALVFGYGSYGKPFLAQPQAGGLRFNLSHSGQLVVIGLALDREIGVDIESVQYLDDWQYLAGRIFSPRELDELKSLPVARQRESFFQGWTQKEAYLKATGEGLTDELTSIGVAMGSRRPPGDGKEAHVQRFPPPLPGGGRRLPWEAREIPLPPGYAGTVVFNETLTAS